MSINIAVLGYGRMGQEIHNCIDAADDLQLASVWVRDESTANGDAPDFLSEDLATVLSAADIALDFTLPAATERIIAATLEARVPLVCGVSGLAAGHLKCMRHAAVRIPILYDRNMSLGIAVMQQLMQLAGPALGKEFEAEIHETHHVHKIDAPSGTALKLGEALAASRGQDFANSYHYGSDHPPGPGDIHFEVVRRGEVPGEHTVQFRNDTETFSLTHEVTDRRVFAVGALRAARWLLAQTPGLYSLQDLVVDSTAPAAR